jgi:hypothetical protein
MKHGVVYTVVTGSKDTTKMPYHNPNWDYFYFTDIRKEDITPWQCVDLKKESQDNGKRKASRLYKIIPNSHPILKNYEYQLYFDGTIELAGDPENLIPLLDDKDLALYKHPNRSCIYVEAEHVINAGREYASVANNVIDKYKSEGYPPNIGLATCAIILRKNTEKVDELNKLWWYNFENGSSRDQLSFDYCCWKLGIAYAKFPGTFNRMEPHFLKYPHAVPPKVTDFNF